MSFSKTKRLCLRYFAPKDVEIFLKYRNDPILNEFQSWPVPYTREMVDEFFIQMTEQNITSINTWVQIALELLDSKELIGDLALNNTLQTVELGITIRKDFQGKGYGKEGLKGLIVCLIVERKVHRFIAIIDVDNVASIALFEGLGFRREGYHIKSYWDEKKNEWRDEYLYALLAEEFQS